jgi:hypothetical protein
MPNDPARPATTPPKLAVERKGSVVKLEIQCADAATACDLYHQVIDGARAGMVRIDLQTVPRPTIDGLAIEVRTLERANVR